MARKAHKAFKAKWDHKARPAYKVPQVPWVHLALTVQQARWDHKVHKAFKAPLVLKVILATQAHKAYKVFKAQLGRWVRKDK